MLSTCMHAYSRHTHTHIRSPPLSKHSYHHDGKAYINENNSRQRIGKYQYISHTHFIIVFIMKFTAVALAAVASIAAASPA